MSKNEKMPIRVSLLSKRFHQLLFDLLPIDINLQISKAQLRPLKPWTLAYSLYQSRTSIKRWREVYFENYWRTLNPHLILTTFDNDETVAKLRSAVPEAKILVFQHGHSPGESRKLASGTEYFFGMSRDSATILGRAFGAKKTVPLGLLQNNASPIGTKQQSNSILFISSFSPPSTEPYYVSPEGIQISHGLYHHAERILLRFLVDWAEKNQLPLRILLRQKSMRAGRGKEREFYKEILKDKKLKPNFAPIKSTPYALIDEAKIVVCIDSSLGYEALSRGKIVFLAPIRGNYFPDYPYHFGAPTVMSEDGPFWSMSLQPQDWEAKLNRLIKFEDVDFQNLHISTIRSVTCYNPNSARAKAIIRKMIVRLSTTSPN